MAGRIANRKSVSRQMAWLAVACAGLFVVSLGVAAAWTINRIDAIAQLEEQKVILSGLTQKRERMAQDMDSSAQWDESVLRLRSADQAWLAENLVDWLSAFYGHERVYALAPDGSVVRAARDGQFAGYELDPGDALVLLPRIARFREQLAQASTGLPDSTDRIKGMGLSDIAQLAGGDIAFITIRPVLPTTKAIRQAPGQEYLLVSVQLVDSPMLAEISDHYGIDQLRLEQGLRRQASVAMIDDGGRIVGWLSWSPSRPALGLAKETAPASISLLVLAALCLAGLMLGLRRTSLKLAQSEDRTQFLAFHDALTGAANRLLFDTRLREALAMQYLARTKVALIAVDLDNFKDVNDTHGHATGDQLIKQVVLRLQHKLNDEATIARLGGDEFAIVQSGIVSDGQARWICQNLLDVFNDPFLLSTGPLTVTASMGVALEYGDAATPEEMLRRADVALYVAKSKGRKCFEIHDDAMERQRRDRRELESELRLALERETGLFLMFQPIFDSASGAIAGAEALVRWQHETRGYLPPDRFIGVAEDSGLINRLGMWVLDAALRTCRQSGIDWVAVNLSPIQFRDSGLAEKIIAALDRHGLQPDRLELEITESALLLNSAQVQATLARLHAAGIRLALDDFGTGYSSLSYIHHYAVDKLKIDKSFIAQLGDGAARGRIVEAIIQLGHAMDLLVTAEGVEQAEQLEMLRALGCDLIQGFLLSRPVTAERLAGMVAETPKMLTTSLSRAI